MNNNNKKKLVCAGVTGLVGRPLVNNLIKNNYELNILCRDPEKAKKLYDVNDNSSITFIRWDAINDNINNEWFENTKGVINLIGENIGAQRLSDERFNLIRKSRVLSSKKLVNAAIQSNCEVYINASAIGYYGTSDEIQNENSVNGPTKISKMVEEWENAVLNEEIKENQNQLRRVILRIGLVLDKDCQIIQQLPPWPIPLTPIISSSLPYPWIHNDDLVTLITEAIENKKMNGIANAVAYNSKDETMESFLRAFCKINSRIYINFSVPKFLINLTMGDIADVIADTPRVDGDRLLNEWKFKCKYNTIEKALEHTFTQ